MNEYIARLIELLTAQRDIYAQLAALSERKRESILGNSVDVLDKVIKEEQLLLARLQELELGRKSLLGSLAVVIGRPAETLSITDILDACPPSLQTSLIQIQKELYAQLQAQGNINEVNRKLIETRLEYLRFMTESRGEGNSYDTSGGDARKHTQGSRIIDLGV